MKRIILPALLVMATYCSYCQTNSFPSTGSAIVRNGDAIEMQDSSGATIMRMFSSKSTWAANSHPGYFQLHRSYIAATDTTLRLSNAASVLDILQFYDNSLPGIRLNGNSGQNSYIRSGRLGIGTTTPAAALDVATNISVGSGADKFNVPLTIWKRGDQFGTDNSVLVVRHSGQGSNTYLNPATDFGIVRITGFDTTAANKAINSHDNFIVFTNGGVSVNTNTVPSGFKMAVKGRIITEGVRIKLSSTGWPDYVFDKGYHLTSLDELENYLQQNHHLPEIPSAEEVDAHGIEVMEMNKLLTKKMEELTLYILMQQKQIAALSDQVELLNKKVSQTKP